MKTNQSMFAEIVITAQSVNNHNNKKIFKLWEIKININ